MAPGVGTGFDRLGSALFPARAEGLWILHHVRLAVTKNVERRDRAVFSILAAELWLVGAVGAGDCWIVRLAYLERQMALGRQTSGGYRICADRSRDFRFRLFRPNRALGLGQPQAHGVGLFYDSTLFVERHHWALGAPGTGGHMSVALRLGIYHVAGGPVCRTPRLWID